MAKLIRFNTTYFDNGAPKYVAGRHYPIMEETLRCVAAGWAEEVEVDLSMENAQLAAVKAAAAAAQAAAAAEQARLLADAARVAQEELDQANTIVAAAIAEEAKARETESSTAPAVATPPAAQ
jgi:hypothetical protein